MAYQSLYRKYRPQTFADVMGQGHVTRTPQNALASGRIAHGYLFTGTRGTAKTTIARLLAKALNCESSDRPVAEPCNRCAACLGITAGSSIDVVEMDAASHRGVADIEEVRNAVGYGPMELRYKVYIIDEAHQLSSDAKDAFLKTLEEPPDNVVFILATTEPQAIPITIRSRCQQFDFKRGSLADIAGRLRYVLDREGVAYADEAVSLIARGAEGSWRDALSLLEQVLAFSPERMTVADVDTVLGTLDAERLARVTDAVARRDAPTAFALAGELLDAGKEARTLLRTLAAHFRDLLLVSVGGPAVPAEFTPDQVARLQPQARDFTTQQMIRAMEVLNEAQAETRWNNQHRSLLELTFLKLMTLGDAPSAPLAVAPIVFATAPAAPAPTQPQRPTPEAPTERPTSTPPVVAASAVPPPAVELTAPTAIEDDLPASFFAEETDDSEGLVEELDDEVDVSEPMPVAADVAESVEEDEGPSLFDEPEFESSSPPLVPAEVISTNGSPAPTTISPSISEPTYLEAFDEVLEAPPAFDPQPLPHAPERAEEIVVAEPATFTMDDVYRVWPRFLADAERLSRQTQTLMLSAEPMDLEGHTIIVRFKNRSAHDILSGLKKKEFVRKLLARNLGAEKVAVRFILSDDVPPPPRPDTGKKGKRDPLAALDTLDILAEEADSGVPSSLAQAPTNGFSESATRRAAVRVAPGSARQEAAASWPIEEEPDAMSALVSGDGKRSPKIEAALENPLVQETLSIFGGEVVSD